LAQIITRFGKTPGEHFLHQFAIFPEVRIVLAPPKGLELLASTYGQIAAIDVSYELTELGLTLATILVNVSGLFVPVVWFITDTISPPNLEWFLRQVQAAVGGAWQLTYCFADFEPALRSAIAQSASNVLTLGDSWHFFHENRKWVRAHGSPEYPFPLTPLTHTINHFLIVTDTS
jgi:hypothetical protein